MKSLSDLRIKVFADGADKRTMLEMLRNPLIRGFTTNPTLMRKAGVSDYASFARDILAEIKDVTQSTDRRFGIPFGGKDFIRKPRSKVG